MTSRAATTPQCTQTWNRVRLLKKKSSQNFWRHSSNTTIQFMARKLMVKSRRKSFWSTMRMCLPISIATLTSNWWWAMHGDSHPQTIRQACHLLGLKRRLWMLMLETRTGTIITGTCSAPISKHLLILRGILSGKRQTLARTNIKAVEQICRVLVVDTWETLQRCSSWLKAKEPQVSNTEEFSTQMTTSFKCLSRS